MKRILPVISFLFSSFICTAGVSTLSGTCGNCAGQPVRLMMYDDLVSFREVVIDEGTVGNNGEFNLSFDVREVRYAWIQVQEFRYDFFLSPDKDLIIGFENVMNDKEIELGFRGTYDQIPQFHDSPGAQLNRDIMEFNGRLDDFMESQYELLMKRRAKTEIGKKIDRFKHEMDSVYSGAKGYLKDHIRYSIAGVELANSRKKEFLFRDYLADGQMLYTNFEFMRFFTQFYAKSMAKLATGERSTEFKKAFQLKEPDGAFQTLLGDEQYMDNVQHRQANYVKGLADLCGTGLYYDHKLVEMLERFSMFSSNGYLGKIAKNLAWRHSRFKEGAKAPDFYARTASGDLVSLKAFEGKPLLIEFSMIGNALCERETVILPALLKEYPNYQAVSFMVNEDKAEVAAFKEKNLLKWPVVRIDRNSKILDAYDVRSVPTYILLDSNGHIIRYDLPEPSRGLDKVFFEIKDRKDGKFSIGKKKSGFHNSDY